MRTLWPPSRWLNRHRRRVRMNRERLSLTAFMPQPTGGALVGGAVRDALLGRPSRDWDWAVDDPAAEARALAAQVEGDAFALDEARGHWRVVQGDRTFDFVPVDGDLMANLQARDFTVNAMALTAEGLVDPHGGLADLTQGVLRQVSDGALLDDPVRGVRGVRLAALLGLEWDTLTRAAAQDVAAEIASGRLAMPAMERIRDELTAILFGPTPGDAILDLHRMGWLQHVLPVMVEGEGVAQGSLHHLDVLEHQCDALQRLVTAFPDAPLEVRLATLMHDVGKPACRSLEGGRAWFEGHATIGAEQTTQALRRLRYSAAVVARASELVGRHMVRLPDSSRSARRFAYRYRHLLPGLLHLMLADREAARGRAASKAGRDRYRQAVARVVSELEALPDAPPLLGGEDVMRLLNVTPGPWVGEALRFVAESRAVGDVASREEAERALHAWWDVQQHRWPS